MGNLKDSLCDNNTLDMDNLARFKYCKHEYIKQTDRDIKVVNDVMRVYCCSDCGKLFALHDWEHGNSLEIYDYFNNI